MPDMLVRLYDMPDHSDLIAKLRSKGVEVRPALALEKDIVVEWVGKTFSSLWGTECERGFVHTPVSTIVAIDNGKLIGFASYDCTLRGFFGPTGVDENQRGCGIGKALLFAALRAMWEVGYGYAIIGSAGPQDFYTKYSSAVVIENSVPGVYRGMLTQSQVK